MEPASRTEGRATQIGRYLVRGRLGRGGMGLVYRGYDEALERPVAIKILTVEGALDEESRRRFEIEAKAAARLQHPNILTVYELGQDRGVPFIAMELLSGADLEGLLRSGVPLLLPEKLDILIQVCRGLAFAHEHGIVHRDMKPSNVRILDDGTAKIMDFGIAKLLGTSLTRSGMMVGTVHYMSPEQIRAQALDGRSDVFSAGVMLYELLSGRRPFVGEDPTQVLYKIVTEPPPEIEADLGEAGPRLRDIVARAMAKDAAARLPSAARMADELGEVLAALTRASPTLAAEEQEALATARRLLKAGQAGESVDRLQGVVERHPDSLEARRVLRAATQETARLASATRAEPEPTVFPELEATFLPGRTERPAETLVQAATIQSAEPTGISGPAPLRRGHHVEVGILAGAVAVGLGLWLALGRPPAPRPPAPAASALPEEGPRPTPASADVQAGPRPAVAAPAPKPTSAPEVQVPMGSLAVISSYPVDVVWRGKILAKGAVSPKVEVATGKQTVTLASATYALNLSATVDVREGAEASLSAPPLGRLSIRASPDNCSVFLDGAFLDYPPILDRPVAAGTRTVAFKWTDGTVREEKAEVTGGNLTYVTGRKE